MTGWRAGADSEQAESSEGGGAVTAILVIGRYIRGKAVNRRYVTPEVGWLRLGSGGASSQ